MALDRHFYKCDVCDSIGVVVRQPVFTGFALKHNIDTEDIYDLCAKCGAEEFMMAAGVAEDVAAGYDEAWTAHLPLSLSAAG